MHCCSTSLKCTSLDWSSIQSNNCIKLYLQLQNICIFAALRGTAIVAFYPFQNWVHHLQADTSTSSFYAHHCNAELFATAYKIINQYIVQPHTNKQHCAAFKKALSCFHWHLRKSSPAKTRTKIWWEDTNRDWIVEQLSIQFWRWW